MTDIDAIRWLASERDLEFVDLDTYGVDPTAGEILPADVARAHHMVAVKRKFGTPVIATSDPDDVSAQDSVRAEIGRDFISVVASREQIGDWIDRLFGTDLGIDGAGTTDEAEVEIAPEREETGPGTGAGLLDAAIEELAVTDLSEDLLPEPQSPSDDAPPTEALVEDVSEESAEPSPGADDSEPPPELEPVVAMEADQPDEPEPADEAAPAEDAKPADDVEVAAETPARGRSVNKRRAKKSSRKESAPALPEGEEYAVSESEGEPTESVEGDLAAVEVETASVGDDDLASTESRLANPELGNVGDELARDVPVEADDALYETPTDSFETPAQSYADDVPLEPATSLLPNFGFAEPGWHETEGTELTYGTEGSAEVFDGVSEAGGWAGPAGGDAADMVADAVASFQEQQWEGRYGEDPPGQGFSTTAAHQPPLAKALLDGERVSPEDMQEVLEEHDRTGQSIARILTAKKLVDEADLMWGMAQEMGLEFVDLDTAGVDLTEAGWLPEATARHHNVIIIGNDNGTPVVAASNPTDVFAMDDLRTIMGRNFNVVVATRSQISSYIGRVFNSGDAADIAAEASMGLDGPMADESVDDIQAITEDAPIVRYVNLLILQALNERASDIHVEPTGAELRIRYRIDGVLHDVSTAPRAISAAVITRLKVMADMNVAEHRIPQDGRISLNVGSKGIDLRIATLPTIHGEKVVMRVLDKSSVVLGFGDLGFDDDLQSTYEGIYSKPYGTILVTGPTGSGKSTTLYTTLTALNSPEKNIITVEDPVELQLKGVNQVQLNVKAGLTFASALKSILRSDPDIVLVGEIRDKETALIAIEAALTGHLVLATLHTNNAASTPMRLIEMGLEPFLVTSSLSGVLAQRLARRLCLHCKEAYEPTEADIAAAGWTPEELEKAGGMSKVYRAVGCSACSNTGYRGRKALAELMPMSEEIERMIIEGGSVDDIHRLAVSQGMTTLRESGLRKAIEGETTLEEVLRVVA